ncbi:oxidoreductase [Lithospermum erythrorhizon]|uniref:Oxidoreductase n=1 Tax=Lithospermum erythrorhizon TaxID=34254 RepID=A0AAV3R8Z6_LITER
MGCVSSTLLSNDNEFNQIGGSATFSHHIVSLTSTTYGFLALEPPPTPPPPPPESHPSPTTTPTPPRLTLGALFTSPCTKNEAAEVINSWELMAGLDSTPQQSFRISKSDVNDNKENSNPNIQKNCKDFSDVKVGFSRKCVPVMKYNKLDEYEKICPPNGEHSVVIYTTTLRGVRKTFEDCNVVRSAIEGFGVSIFERDIWMDRGFRDELRELLKCKENSEMIPPRVFIKGKYIGGVEEVVWIFEDGELGELLQGLPRLKAGYVCEGCGGARFLPCFSCNGSCKMVDDGVRGRTMVVRCSNCNENGLVQCPICC